jgi:hypothetical protein
MPLEPNVTYIDDLVIANPEGTDARSEGDDHIRNIKRALQNCFPDMGQPLGFDDDGGAADAYAVSFTTGAPTAYGKFMLVGIIPANDNTGASTLDVNSIGATAIKIRGVALGAGQIRQDQPALFLHDGTDFEYINPPEFPKDTRMVFYQASAPVGWTQVTSADDRVLRVVSGSGGSTGGSWSGSFGTTDPGGWHKHDIHRDGWGTAGGSLGTVQAGRLVVGSGNPESQENLESLRAAGNDRLTSSPSDEHSHDLSASGDWRPAYIDVIVAEKD